MSVSVPGFPWAFPDGAILRSFLDASFLLTVEVFLLTVLLFTCGGGTVSKESSKFGEP